MELLVSKRIGLIIVLTMIIHIIGSYDQLAEIGQRNVQLTFNFSWTTEIQKLADCYKEQVYIGRCSGRYLIDCSVVDTSIGIFSMSTTNDLSAVNITVMTFDETTAGTYSCSKENNVQKTAILILAQVNLTAASVLPQTSISYPVYNEGSNFTCFTSKSRPLASIDWFENQRNITDNASYTYTSDVATSVLRYIPTSYHDRNLYCIARYVYKTINITIHRVVKLQIQFPVTRPSVTVSNKNVTDSVIIRENDSVEFKCSSSGCPPPSYSWVYPGGTATGHMVVLQFNRTSNLENISCEANNTILSLNGSMSNRPTQNVTTLMLNVSYTPTFKRFINKNENFTINDNIKVVRGDNINVVCEWDANPAATVYWQGQQTNSSSLTLTNIQQDTVWTCLASNFILEANGMKTLETSTNNLSAAVLYGPGVPTIKYSVLSNLSRTETEPANGLIKLIEGSSVQLMCAADSRPNSTYSWGPGYNNNTRVISNVSRNTEKSFTCKVDNIMDTTIRGNISGSNNSTIHMDVLYGPGIPTAKYNDIYSIYDVLKVINGRSFTISCLATSNPNSSIDWHGPGKQVESYLVINNVNTTMPKNLTCIATNTMLDSLEHRESKSSSLTFTLDVLYPPVVQQIQNQTILQNRTLTIECSLFKAGNPGATNFTWIRIDTNTSVGTGQTLSINSIELTDEGEYQCTATNAMQQIGNKTEYGVSKSVFSVDVQYGANIETFNANGSVTTLEVDQGEMIQLVCYASGDPEPVVSIVNATRGREHLLIEKEALTVTSKIHPARCEYDAGRYKCLAYNSHNRALEQFLNVSIKCSPRASPFSRPITEQYRAPNDSVVLTFTIIAYPEPTMADFTWLKRVDDGWMGLSNDSNFQVNISENSMQTQLTILHIQLEDFTEYMVNVSNALGSISTVFSLNIQSRPEVPKEIRVIGVGKTEITIEWIPGFNGGEDQNFIVRYKDAGTEHGMDIHVKNVVKKSTWTIEGLKPGTTYIIKMQAQNKIGKSNWTTEITETTLADTVDNRSTSPVIGGTVGGAALVGIIAAFVIWRYRERAINKSDSKQTLTRRSTNHANGTYENLGMLTPNHERKTTKHATALSRPGNERQISREHAHKLAPNVSKNNKHSSETLAVKSAPVKYEKHILQKIDGKTAPAKNDIQGLQNIAGKPIPLTDKVQSSQTHETVIVDIPDAPIATSSKDIYSLQRRDSFSIERDPIYDNLYKTKKQFKSRKISVQNLRETVVRDKDHKTDVFTEYSALNDASEKLKYSTNAAMKPANTSKNRYKNMYPYDKNRVTLSVIGNDIDTDFINASFIDGYSSPKKYIAAQGPLAGTRADLWRLIWEKNVKVVVMVTNLVEESKRKCFQYWPTDAGNDCQYGDSTIHLLAEETYADFVIRTLQCSRMGSSKTVTHLHFTAWPDKDVPDSVLSLMQFWRKVRSVEKPVDAPWIVHCSAGVGRTGTFIALDCLYEQGVSEKQINVFDAVLLLREQRINMVQTKNQYLYLHEVLCEALCPVGEVLSNKQYLDNKCTSDYLNQEYKAICQLHIPDREEETADGDYIKVLDGEKPENMKKNVDPCVVPDDKYRPVLNVAINTKGHTDYINAVYISTFEEGDRLILTQSAKTSSDIDFVRLLHDHYVRTVVTLSDHVEPYLPESGESIVIGPFTASTVSCAQKHHFQEYVVRFKHIGERESFDVQVFRFTKWSKQFDLCKINQLLSLLTDVQERASTEGPVGIQCSDGYSRSGLVAVLWCLMERSKRDGVVAVAETVRMIRRRREQVITNEAQYRLCHEFMKEYVEGCLVYANT